MIAGVIYKYYKRRNMKTIKDLVITGAFLFILISLGSCSSAISCAAYKPHYNVKYLKKHDYVLCPIGTAHFVPR